MQLAANAKMRVMNFMFLSVILEPRTVSRRLKDYLKHFYYKDGQRANRNEAKDEEDELDEEEADEESEEGGKLGSEEGSKGEFKEDSTMKYDSGESKIGESELPREVSSILTFNEDPPIPLVLNPEQRVDTNVASSGPVTIA